MASAFVIFFGLCSVLYSSKVIMVITVIKLHGGPSEQHLCAQLYKSLVTVLEAFPAIL